MENRRVRVRFAPSPTGPLHIGGVRTALYNYLFARKNGGDFILRIEDTDQNRFVPGAENYIIEALKWCCIQPNEGVGFGDGIYGPYRQSDRKSMYRQFADQLISHGYAYYAFDTAEELEDMRNRLSASGVSSPQYNAVTRQSMKNSITLPEDEVKQRLEGGEAYVIRIKIPRNEEVKVFDLIRGWVVVNSAQMDDKVLFKSDGMPTYHLANVVDDYTMKITHVIRGEEWLPSAPLHVLLYRYLGWEEVMPQFAHLPLLLKPDGHGKLSKRDGDRLGFPVFPLEWKDPFSNEISSGYREKGYFPDAVINFLAFLGWNPGSNQEIFTKEELVNAFSLDRVSKSGAKFDFEKAKWFNQQYLRNKSNEEIATLFLPIIEGKGYTVSMPYLVKVCGLIKEKAHFVSDLWDLGNFFFQEPESYNDEVIKKRWNEASGKFISELINNFESLTLFDAENTEAVFKQTAETNGISAGSVMQLFRVCISGQAGGPVLFDVVALLEKKLVIDRLQSALQKFPKFPVNQ